MQTDQYYMNRCIELGKAAEEDGNPPVGSLIVKANSIISEAKEAGRSKNDITCHAEIESIREAVKILGTTDLSDCTLYTTHEPCIMCSYVIRFYKIKRVVFLHSVDYLGGITSAMPLLTTTEVPPHWSKPPEITKLNID